MWQQHKQHRRQLPPAALLPSCGSSGVCSGHVGPVSEAGGLLVAVGRDWMCFVDGAGDGWGAGLGWW